MGASKRASISPTCRPAARTAVSPIGPGSPSRTRGWSRISTTQPTYWRGSPRPWASAIRMSTSPRSTNRPMRPAPPPASAPAAAESSIEELFIRSGALREGHFLLKSGRHSGRYLEKFQVLQYPSLGVEIGRRLAGELVGYEPTLVVGPTTGGVLLAFETARQLSELLGREVRGIFAEPADPVAGSGRSGRVLRRGWPIAPDERVVLVDDILTTGASLIETAGAVRAVGVSPLAAVV